MIRDVEFCIGSRVRDADGFVATIRYIGPVAAAKNKTDIWLGVEWDDQSRGKHDGSCVDEKGDYHRHFVCANGAGSFLKKEKVCMRKTLMEALCERYVSVDAPEIAQSDATLPHVFVPTLKGNQKSIEFVGEKHLRKRQQIQDISSVTLVNDSVAFMDSALGSISHLTEVNLQNNLLWKWEEIASLGRQLLNLKVLLLHGNRFQTLSSDSLLQFDSDVFRNLRVLALNNCNIKKWSEIQLLEPFLPGIEELYLSGNLFPDLPRSNAELEYQAATGIIVEPEQIVHGFTQLRLLDLSNCKLDEWSQVMAFASVPSLREFVLDSNLLDKISAKPDDSSFNNLFRFSLSGNKFSSWKDIDMLALNYPHLRVLRLSQIPLFDGKGSSEVRPIMISRIAQLETLNGSQIGPRERTDAERGYLRTVMFERKQLLKHVKDEDVNAVNAVDATISTSHPRYSELVNKYATEMPAGDSLEQKNSGGTLAADLIGVTLRNMSFKSNGSLEPLSKKLPKHLTVLRLKTLVQQLFGLELRLQQLSMRIYKDSVPFVLDDESQTLEYFGAIDGAEIFINEAKG